MRIVIGGIDGALPAAWVGFHVGFLSLAGNARPNETEEELRARQARLHEHAYVSELYAYATYLKWDCALGLQNGLASLADLEGWHAKKDRPEAMTLLRLEDAVTGEVVGLLLLRFAWNNSVVFEFLNVRIDVKARFDCRPAAALVAAGLQLAERYGRGTAWVETGPGSSDAFWRKVLPSQMAEVRHAAVSDATREVSSLLLDEKIVLTLQGVPNE